MAYSYELAQRIRLKLSLLSNIKEKEMMGGLTFLFNDKKCIGIIKDEMMCRVDPEIHEILLEKQGCRTMDFTKRPMKGYVMVDETGLIYDKDFDYWINLCLDYNSKAKKSKKKK